MPLGTAAYVRISESVESVDSLDNSPTSSNAFMGWRESSQELGCTPKSAIERASNALLAGMRRFSGTVFWNVVFVAKLVETK